MTISKTVKNLVVLHAREYRKPSSEVSTLKSLSKTLKPLVAMSCARLVYIFIDSNPESVDTIDAAAEKMKLTSSLSESLHGIHAYIFLLSWFSGFESSKISGDDHFVLGSMRTMWSKEGAKKKNYKYRTLLESMLLQDASLLRRIMDDCRIRGKELSSEHKAIACRNIAIARTRCLVPSTENIFEKSDLYIASIITRLRAKATRDIASKQIACSRLCASNEHTVKTKTQKVIFSDMLHACFLKRDHAELEAELETKLKATEDPLNVSSEPSTVAAPAPSATTP